MAPPLIKIYKIRHLRMWRNERTNSWAKVFATDAHTDTHKQCTVASVEHDTPRNKNNTTNSSQGRNTQDVDNAHVRKSELNYWHMYWHDAWLNFKRLPAQKTNGTNSAESYLRPRPPDPHIFMCSFLCTVNSRRQSSLKIMQAISKCNYTPNCQ